MENSKLKIGDVVNIPPEVTGHGSEVLGFVAELEYFMDYTLATVKYLRPYRVNGNSSMVCMADKLIPFEK